MNTSRLLLRGPLVVCALIVLLFSSNAHAQFGYDTVSYQCDSSRTVSLGQTFRARGSIDDTLLVVSNSSEFRLGDTAYIFWNGDTANITITQTTDTTRVGNFYPPRYIVSDSIFRFSIHYQPQASAPARSEVDLEISRYPNGICSDTLYLIGTTADSASNDSIPLVSNVVHTVPFIALQDTTLERIPLYNNLLQPLKISSLHFFSGSVYRIDTTFSFPITLPSHRILDLPFLFAPKRKGQNNDYLIVTMPDEPILHDVVPVQGFFDPPSGSVHINVTRAAHFAVYPNPARGEIIVHTESLLKPRVEITDLLGRRIEQSSFSSDWQWDRETLTGGTATSGAYFLIVSGTTEGGQPIREVQTIVLE